MKILIYMTGKINSPFLTNEISIMKEYFDVIHVIGYDRENDKAAETAEKYGFTYDTLENIKINDYHISEFIKWIKKDYVKKEIREKFDFTINGLKRLFYILYYGIYYCKVKKILISKMTEEADVYLYSFWMSRPAFAIANFNIERKNKIKRIVSRAHRYDLYEEENKYNYLPFRRFICENIDTIYFSSNDSMTYYINKRYSEKEKQACNKLTYLGTLYPDFCVDYSQRQRMTIVSCAYISQRKRLDLIIDLIEKISEINPYVKWIHIGSGELEEKIKRYASIKLKKGTYEFKGNVEDKTIFEIYKSNNPDFFVNLSDSEGIPVSLLEALSVGIPGVIRNVGGNGDAIVNNINGILLDAVSPDDKAMADLAKKMISIYDNKERHMEMSSDARKMWKDKFDANKNIAQICKDIIEGSVIKERG